MATPDDAPTGRVTRASVQRELNATTSTARVPKRKNPRTSGDGAAPLPVPARKRSKPSVEPEVPSQANGSVRAASVVPNGSVGGERRVSHALPARLATRHSSSSFRHAKAETSGQILSRTEYYTIKQLPGLPDNLRKDTTAYKAYFQSLSQHAHEVIVTTHSSVLIWDYNTTITSPVPTTVRIPEPLKSNNKLPLAATVPNAASAGGKDAGLVVVCPESGKIYYWEALDNTASYSIYSRTTKWQEETIPLMRHEVIENMVRVEHGGHVLVLSSGRVAYLALQDRNSRPSISWHILENETHSKNSWLGSLGSLMGGGWRNTIAGVDTRAKSNRFETIALTQEGLLKVWDVEYSGSATFKTQMDLSGDVRDAFEQNGVIDKNGKTPITFVDFALTKKASSAVSRQSGGGDTFALDAIILVAITKTTQTNFQLAHVNIGNSKVDITRLTPINVFHREDTRAIEPSHFNLIIPDPGHVAFIVFPNAIILVSLEKIYANLREELKSSVYQDIVYFQFKLGAEITAAAPEYRRLASSDTCGLLLFTKSKGAVRITAERPPKERAKQAIGPKSKIEQQVFYGKVAQSILDFPKSGSFDFEQRDVENAALELSHEILTSKNDNITDRAGSSNMEMQIYWRVQQLQRLIEFVLNRYNKISRPVRWRLLWDAEKLEAAAKLWKVYEKWLNQREGDEKILFPLFVEALNENDRSDAGPESSETDLVRHWFAHDVPNIGRLLKHIERVIMDEHKSQKAGWELLVQYVAEGQEVIRELLDSAYNFRVQHLESYGLKDEKLDADGILADSNAYAELSEPWTATKNVTANLESFVSESTRLLVDLHEGSSNSTASTSRELLYKLCKEQWKPVFLSCLVHEERVRWLLSRPDEEERANGERIKRIFEADIRPDMLLGLADLGRGGDGMQIAEKLHDMQGLVQLAVTEIEYLTDPDERLRMTAHEKEVNKKRLEDLYARIEKYFQRYGKEFWWAFFTAQIYNGRLADILQQQFARTNKLSEKLSELPEYRKLEWIHLVRNEKKLTDAGEALLHLAFGSEDNIWASTVELSLSKLAFDAAKDPKKPRRKKQAADGADAEQAETLRGYVPDVHVQLERKNVLKDAQIALFQHMRPDFLLGVDEQGSIDVAMERSGKFAVRDRPANEALLREGFTKLNAKQVLDPELLIDVFTLMDANVCADEALSIHDKVFVWALKVLDASGFCDGRDSAKGEALRNLIWKRLAVRDDWVRIHQTKGKRDKEIAKKLLETFLFQTLKQGGLEHLWSWPSDDEHSEEDLRPKTGRAAFSVPRPVDTLGALSTPDSLKGRFTDEDIIKKVAKDNTEDDELLTDYNARCRLSFHFDSCKKLAKQAVDDVYEDRQKRKAKKLKEIQKLYEKDVEIRKGGKGGRKGGLVGELPNEEQYILYDETGAEGEEVLTQGHLDALEEETGMEVDG